MRLGMKDHQLAHAWLSPVKVDIHSLKQNKNAFLSVQMDNSTAQLIIDVCKYVLKTSIGMAGNACVIRDTKRMFTTTA